MNLLQEAVDPMLATLTDTIPEGDYFYEVKGMGSGPLSLCRIIRITSRNKNDITEQFPELKTIEAFMAENGIFDAEIVALDKNGRPSFKNVIQRIKTTSPKKIERLSQANPVQCYVFDCLYLNGQQVMNQALEQRYQLLKDTMHDEKHRPVYSE